MAAAIVVPRNVIAITSVASSVQLWNVELYAYSALMGIDGISIRASAAQGTPPLDTLAAHSGRTRSNAVANTTRVEERNTDPTQPRNHSVSKLMKMNWRIRLP